MFIDNKGDPTLANQELKAIADAESSPSSEPLSHISSGLESGLTNLHLQNNSDSSLFSVRTSTALQNGKGTFASTDIQRGCLMLSEIPLFHTPTVTSLDAPEPRSYISLEAAVRKLSPAHLDGYLSLQNSHDTCSCFRSPLLGIFNTNSFIISDGHSGICLTASRFNHSCTPNASFGFNASIGMMRCFALRDIPRGEEIFVSYIDRRQLYGGTRGSRQAYLRATYHFTCACSVCSLPESESKRSDARRQRLKELWEIVGRSTPTQEDQSLKAINEGVRLLQEEGCLIEADDFMREDCPM